MSSETIYSDVDLSFGRSITNDVAKKLNINAIKQSIKNIVLTRHKLFFPDFGSGMGLLLFEIIDPVTLELLKDGVISSIKNREPRVDRLNVTFNQSNIDDNEVICNVQFTVFGIAEKHEFDFVVQVLR